MNRSIAAVALLVRDYDEAIAWFTGKLEFSLIEDTQQGPAKRWVLVAPMESSGSRIVLAKAEGQEQEAMIGQQGGGRVWLFLETDDFSRDHSTMRSRGVEFIESPRSEIYGSVAVFKDLYGNKWDLIQRTA